MSMKNLLIFQYKLVKKLVSVLRIIPASTSEAAAVQWMDLPEDLTEKILERLTIKDYVRFGAVCRGWRAIQRVHRLRHSPSSPPAVKIPWFIPYRPREESVICSVGLPSSEEQQRLHIPFSPAYLGRLERNEAAEGSLHPPFSSFSSLPYGWLLFDDRPLLAPAGCHHSYEFSLLNPITGVQIRLPILRDLHLIFRATISPPPRCDVLVITPAKRGNKLHLYRRGNPCWTYWWLNRHDSGARGVVASVIYYAGKFYCFRLGNDLVVVDIDCPIGNQIEPHYLQMDQSLLPKAGLQWHDPSLETFLVESNGKMLLVCTLFDYSTFFNITCESCDLVRLELFEADLSNRRWVKADGLGDHAILIYRHLAVSLGAADVGVKQNCIYVVESPMRKEKQVPWNMFDLSTGKVADASLPFPPSTSTHLMFVPGIY